MLHLWCRHACLVFLQHGLDLEVGKHFNEKFSPKTQVNLSENTHNTPKPTWLGMATQSRLSWFFFLPLWPERGALPSKCPPETSQGSKILVMFRCDSFLMTDIDGNFEVRSPWQLTKNHQKSFHKEESTTTIQQLRPVGHVKSLYQSPRLPSSTNQACTEFVCSNWPEGNPKNHPKCLSWFVKGAAVKSANLLAEKRWCLWWIYNNHW